MKSVVLADSQSTAPLEVIDLPEPVIRTAHQVLVRLQAAGVNPIDIKIRNNPDLFPITRPYVPGFDGAGVIEALGAEVTDFAVGDEVYFCQCAFHGDQGSYAEYALVDQSLVARKPETLDFAHAAAIPLVLITAWEALFERARLQSGQSVFVPAGAGGVGHLAVQLAARAGAEVYTSVSTAQKMDFVRSLGADQVILYKEQDVIDSIMEKTGGRGVDLSFDTLGGPIFEQCIECTRHYGEVVSILQPGPEVGWRTARLRNHRISFELMLSPALFRLNQALAHQGEILRRCSGRFDNGELRVRVADTFPLDDAYLAQNALEHGSPMGKICLSIE